LHEKASKNKNAKKDLPRYGNSLLGIRKKKIDHKRILQNPLALQSVSDDESTRNHGKTINDKRCQMLFTHRAKSSVLDA